MTNLTFEEREAMIKDKGNWIRSLISDLKKGRSVNLEHLDKLMIDFIYQTYLLNQLLHDKETFNNEVKEVELFSFMLNENRA